MVIRAAMAAVGAVVDTEAEPPGAIQEVMGETKGADMMDTEMAGDMTDTAAADMTNMKRFVKNFNDFPSLFELKYLLFLRSVLF